MFGLFGDYLAVLLFSYAAVLFWQHGGKSSSSRDLSKTDERDEDEEDAPTPKFKAFQTEFLVVFLVMMAADWMQGPYVYRLYQYYGYSRQDNGILFIAGFGSSLVFGTWAGPIADSYGRRWSCILYGVTYTLSCATKFVNNFSVLMVGRLLGGIATSILWSSFEAWMVSEHTTRGFSPKLVSSTFSLMTSLNGVVAILSGFLAQFSVYMANDHPVAPFALSGMFLIFGSLFIRRSWTENYGSQTNSVVQQMREAAAEVCKSRRVFLVGAQQALFEGAMYTFVFMWTPALDVGDEPIPHGLVFASFMLACSLGSTLFGAVVSSIPAHTLLIFVFAGAAATMATPMVTRAPSAILGAFIGFEMLVGLFWPSIGTLRSQVVPENCRATMINLFRVPLNLIVCLVLWYQGSISVASVFVVCTLFHLMAAAAAILLYLDIKAHGTAVSSNDDGSKA